jgi:GT2 family glycosyltransferase
VTAASAPTVRIIVLNYNGGAMTTSCLHAMVQTDWPADALNVVLVDNASSDGVVETVRRELPQVEVIRSDENLGFAGGMNLGLRDLPPDTDYVALVNNDVTVDPGWLSPLVAASESDADIGAACPKILLADRYEEIQIVGPARRLAWSDGRRVTVQVSGARIDGSDVGRRVRFAQGFWGPEFTRDATQPPFEWATADARLLFPAPVAGVRELRLTAARPTRVVLRNARSQTEFLVGTAPGWYELPPGEAGFDVINNVGSELRPDGYVQDRGYLDRDCGQYDRPETVFAWCGATVLLRGSYLRSVGTLDERLFTYYEDIDMAWRGKTKGWNYVTAPDSVVHHIHMATSAARLPVTTYYNERNRLLVLSRYAPRSTVASAFLRALAATGSYAKRDVIARALRGARPSWTVTALRLRALRDFLFMRAGLAPRSMRAPKRH